MKAFPLVVFLVLLTGCSTLWFLTERQQLLKAAGQVEVALLVADAIVHEADVPQVVKGPVQALAQTATVTLQSYQTQVEAGAAVDAASMSLATTNVVSQMLAYYLDHGINLDDGTATDITLDTGQVVVWTAKVVAVLQRAIIKGIALKQESDALVQAGQDPTHEQIQKRVDDVLALNASIQG